MSSAGTLRAPSAPPPLDKSDAKALIIPQLTTEVLFKVTVFESRTNIPPPLTNTLLASAVPLAKQFMKLVELITTSPDRNEDIPPPKLKVSDDDAAQ